MENKLQYSNRAYAILAINKNDPNDILGWCSGSKWHHEYVSYFVAIRPAALTNAFTLENKLAVKYGNKTAEKALEDAMKFDCSQSSKLPQTVYNLVRHYVRRKPIGYDIKVFRVNSKYCPILIDLRYNALFNNRLLSNKYKDKWNKHAFQFRPFVVKATHPNYKFPENFLDNITIPSQDSYYNDKLKEFTMNNDLSNVEKHKRLSTAMTRHEFQRLNKQRRNNLRCRIKD